MINLAQRARLRRLLWILLLALLASSGAVQPPPSQPLTAAAYSPPARGRIVPAVYRIQNGHGPVPGAAQQSLAPRLIAWPATVTGPAAAADQRWWRSPELLARLTRQRRRPPSPRRF